jgi:membrane-associated protease RseP (regulator of RpoE activity)
VSQDLRTIPARAETDPPVRFDWRKNAVLFLLTVLAVFWTGSQLMSGHGPVESLLDGWPFAVPLLLILLFHEFGHWIAAKRHGVAASLPYFIPLPVLSLLGTMGAVIVMPYRIRSRNALLDIGAAGPLAGMVVAIPTMVIGLRLSEVLPKTDSGYFQEGQSILYWLIKRYTLGPIPPHHDVFIHPTALAAWGGFLITMINLLPWGQLDGGHIAYALLGERHHQAARWVRRVLLVLFAINLYQFVWPTLTGSSSMPLGTAIGNSMFWLAWYGVTELMGRNFGGFEHPPTEFGTLSPGRRLVAFSCLLLFVVLFMPVPWAAY